MDGTVELAVVEGDVVTFEADVVALKYAQHFHGADALVMQHLAAAGVGPDEVACPDGSHRLVSTRGGIAAPRCLYVGMPSLKRIRYAGVAELGGRVIHALHDEAPEVRHVAMTIHGPGFGLDEVEAARSLVAGIRLALPSRRPSALARVTIVEHNRRRVQNLWEALGKDFDRDPRAERVPGARAVRLRVPSEPSASPPTAVDRDREPHVFVAMPFSKEMDDVFYYGIQAPIRKAGRLCERVDQAIFSGDILTRILHRIETADAVVVELTGANPNVYLELGYAWAKARPTVLLARDPSELRFDVQSQRCILYESIRDLEDKLDRELAHVLTPR